MQFIDQSGAGTESVFGGAFKDDPGGLELKHDRGGLLSMANTGPDSNTSHFSIVVAPAPHLNGKCGSVYIAACTTSQIHLQVCNILLALLLIHSVNSVQYPAGPYPAASCNDGFWRVGTLFLENLSLAGKWLTRSTCWHAASLTTLQIKMRAQGLRAVARFDDAQVISGDAPRRIASLVRRI